MKVSEISSSCHTKFWSAETDFGFIRIKFSEWDKEKVFHQIPVGSISLDVSF